MKITLLGWRSEGLRVPDISVDFERPGRGGETFAVSLIQMPNGTGKTTTLELLTASLTGTASDWSDRKVAGFRRRGALDERGTFVARLLVDEEPIDIEMTLNFATNKVSYRTVSPSSGGSVERFDPPRNAKKYLNEAFVKLFFFDAEYAEELFDPGKRHADSSLDALFQLYLFGEIHDASSEYVRNLARDGASRPDQLERLERDRDKLSGRLDTLRRQRSELNAQLEQVRAEASKLREEREALASDDLRLIDELRRHEGLEQRANAQLSDALGEALRHALNPSDVHPAFANALRGLSAQLESLKLPENTSRDFFDDLAEAERCVCGRPIDAEVATVIRERAADYLGSAHMTVIAELRGAGSGDASPDALAARLDSASAFARDAEHARQDHEQVFSQIDGTGRERSEEIAVVLRTREKELAKGERALEMLDAPEGLGGNRAEHSIADAELKLKRLDERYAEASETVTLHTKQRILGSILERALEDARQELREAIVNEVNRGLQSVLERDTLQVASIDDAIRLEGGQSGGSVGQNVSVSYVFLTTLLGRGRSTFPLIVDSPAGPLDLNIRRRIAELVPRLTRQFVGFVTSSEREGFVDALAESSTEIQYLTLVRRTPGTEALHAGEPESTLTVSENAVLVEGKRYFDRFDSERQVED